MQSSRNTSSHELPQTIVLPVVVRQNLVRIYHYEVRAARGATGFKNISTSADLEERGVVTTERRNIKNKREGTDEIHFMKSPGLGCMDEIELKTTALLRLQQFLNCSRQSRTRVWCMN